MADIQSAAAEIRREKKEEEEEEERRRTNHSMKIYMVSLLHRATIKESFTCNRVGAKLYDAKIVLVIYINDETKLQLFSSHCLAHATLQSHYS